MVNCEREEKLLAAPIIANGCSTSYWIDPVLVLVIWRFSDLCYLLTTIRYPRFAVRVTTTYLCVSSRTGQPDEFPPATREREEKAFVVATMGTCKKRIRRGSLATGRFRLLQNDTIAMIRPICENRFLDASSHMRACPSAGSAVGWSVTLS